jgi:hypothetical protein
MPAKRTTRREELVAVFEAQATQWLLTMEKEVPTLANLRMSSVVCLFLHEVAVGLLWHFTTCKVCSFSQSQPIN